MNYQRGYAMKSSVVVTSAPASSHTIDTSFTDLVGFAVIYEEAMLRGNIDQEVGFLSPASFSPCLHLVALVWR